MKQFLIGVFSDNEQPSFSRIASGVLVVFAVGWVTAVVVHTKNLPDPSELLALGGFITLFYGANRLTQGIGAKPPGPADPHA